MALETILKIIGWILVGVPITVFAIIAAHMIQGAAKDDESVKALAILGVTIFLLGFIILALLYLTDLFPRLIAG